MNAGWGRRLATGANGLLVALFGLGLAVGTTLLAERYRWRLDLSEDGSASVAPETDGTLRRLSAGDQRVTITAFSAQRKDAESFVRDRMMRDLLREMDLRSDNLETRFVDFDRDRLTAEALGVDRYGTVVVASADDRVDLIDREMFRHKRGEGKERHLDFVGEAPIAAAIEQVLAKRSFKIYSLAGHGEHEIFDRGLGEWKGLANLIDAQGFVVKTIDLLRDRSESGAVAVPDDAAAVILLGPKRQLGAAEEEALRDYLLRGGRVGLYLDPGGAVPRLLDEVGVAVVEGVVLDREVIRPFVDRPLLRYRSHAITAALAEDDAATVVSRAAPLALTTLEGVDVAPLLQTSRTGWVERGDLRQPVYDPGVDREGPVDVAVAVTVRAPHAWARGGKAGARVLVVGDSDLASDEVLGEGPGNPTFVANGLRWLVGADDRMGRVGRASPVRRVALTEGQLVTLRAVAMGAVPFAALVLGLGILAMRRRR